LSNKQYKKTNYKFAAMMMDTGRTTQHHSMLPQPQQIYYDTVMPCGYSNPNYQSEQASEVDQRNTPILIQPSDYTCSILRLQIPGGAIPLKIMEMIHNAADPTNVNNTIYTVQMIGPANTSTVVHIQWATQNALALVPPTLVAGQTIYPDYVDYYSLFSLQHWCQLMNVALNAAYIQLTGLTGASPPFFAFDGATELFTLYTQDTFITPDNGSIIFNTPWHNLFGSSFAMRRLQDPQGNVGYRPANFFNGLNKVAPTYISGVIFVTQTQDYSTVNTSDFMSLCNIFVTSDLSSRLQLEPNYVRARNSNVFNAAPSSANQQRNVLTNFGITNGNVRQDIAYVPLAEYRRMEMLSSSPLYGITMGVYWEDSQGNLYPIKITAGKTVNMLLLFEHKDVLHRQ